MKSLIHALHRKRSAGVPLPDVFPSLAAAGVRFRKGQVHMIAAQPGAGKSLLSLYLAMHAGVTTLYISADSDEDTVFNRVAAQLLDLTTSEVEEMRESPAVAYLESELAEPLRDIRFVFDPSPTLDTIEDELDAWIEVYGREPDLVVVDNLSNIVPDGNDAEYQGYLALTKEFHNLAHSRGSCLIVLHHTSESKGSPDMPPTRDTVQGKVSQYPEMILTMALEPVANELRIATVKNRSGKADAKARSYVTLHVDLESMKVSEQPLVASTAVNAAVKDYWDGVA